MVLILVDIDSPMTPQNSVQAISDKTRRPFNATVPAPREDATLAAEPKMRLCGIWTMTSAAENDRPRIQKRGQP